MPLTAKGQKILRSMQAEYGAEKGKSVFYASRNKGAIRGVEQASRRLREALFPHLRRKR